MGPKPTLTAAPAILTPRPVRRVDRGLPGLPAMWRCDLSDDALTWDDGVFDLFGIDRATRLDRRAIVEMYDAASRELLDILRPRAIAGAASFTFEARIIRPDGTARWMRVVADTIVRNGRVTHLYGSKRDISDEMTSAPTA